MNTLQKTLDRLRADRNYALSERNSNKYTKTGKVKYLRRGMDHADKGEDLELLATAPHAKRKEAKEYIKKRRSEIDDKRFKDYLLNGAFKKYYED